MSKEGSLLRIAKYKRTNRMAMAEDEQAFFDKTYGTTEAPKKEAKPSKK